MTQFWHIALSMAHLGGLYGANWASKKKSNVPIYRKNTLRRKFADIHSITPCSSRNFAANFRVKLDWLLFVKKVNDMAFFCD